MSQQNVPYDTDQRQCASGVLWKGLPQSANIASPTFSEKIQNSLNLSLYLHLSNISDLILGQFKNALLHCNI
jgi:hypothetical protein